MINGGIMKLFVVVMFLVRGSFSCKTTSTVNGKPTMAPPLYNYNCTFENPLSNTSVVIVRNITNTTEILCQAFVDFSENLENLNAPQAKSIQFCNHLGDTVCPNCTNDTSYEDVIPDIRTSCANEETTTMSATTADFSTQSRTTEAAKTTQYSSATEQMKMETTTIIAVVAGIVILVLLVVVIFFICKRKRTPKESKATIQNEPNDQVVRIETSETGEFYTVLNRKQNGAGVATNGGPLYDDVHDVEVLEDAEFYTEVNKNGRRNGASDGKKKKQDGRRHKNAIEAVVYESRPGQQKDGENGDVEDTQLYNVLHQPTSVRENDVLYSVLNAER